MAATLLSLHKPDTVLPPPTTREVTRALASGGQGVVALLLARRLLLPLVRPCPNRYSARECGGTLHPQTDLHFSDGISLRCHTCKGEWSVRGGSIFAHTRVDLAVLALVLGDIEARNAISHSARTSGICYDTVASMYREARQRMWLWLQRNPILFDEDDVVEIDELYLKQLQPRKDEVGKPVWVIGMIARGTGRVALEVTEDHKQTTMREVINRHLVRSTTVTLSDKHKSFSFLERERRHFWSEKRHKGDRLWMVVDEVLLCDHYGPGENVKFEVHTNTIEGFWSHCRRELRGAQANTLHLYMAEIMYRRLGIPITHALMV